MGKLIASLCLIVPLAVAISGRPVSEDEKLNAFFDRFLEAEFVRHPYDATAAGDHRYDDRLDDLSEPARKAAIDAVRKSLSELDREIRFEALTPAGQIDFEILRHHLVRSIWLADNFQPFEDDPRVYNDYLTNSVYLLFTQSTLPREQNVRNAASRIRFVPGVVAVAKSCLRRPPRQFVETAIAQNRGAIAFYESGLFTIAGEPAAGSPLAEPARAAVAALKDYQQFLEKELMPRATGEWRIGREKFLKKLDLELNAGIPADEVLREALSEAARVEREMVVIARQLWFKLFPGRAVPPDDEPGRRELVRSVLAQLSEDRGSAESLVADAKSTVDKIRQFITRRDILRLPEPDRCRIVEMPEFQRGQSTAYLNPAPPLDPRAESYYAVSPPPAGWDARMVDSYFREYNRAMMQILTIHEAYPGHYVQLEYSNRCPSKIRRLLYSGVFVEGWAVYSEQMMLDEGYGDGDLSLRLHQLKWYLRAVTNAILDHQMHAGTMSDDEAMDLLVNRAFQTEGEARGKIIRAKQSSAQLSTYFVGRTAFHRLRQKVQRELGDRFELGRYHEAVLDFGSLPVRYLPRLVPDRLARPR
jgi:uncharacterized protein (DUF885 family)